ncbi:MAG: response regulator [Elusimicrobia bacterium]|nr:response regulator [Elusimicrobiota bacterium]
MVKLKKILIVDDEKEFCELLVELLHIEGYHSKYALNGQSAIKLCKSGRFDIIFMDLLMPGIHGDELLDKIKKISPKTKVFIITGRWLDENNKKKLVQKGISGYLEKPFQIEKILKILKKLK